MGIQGSGHESSDFLERWREKLMGRWGGRKGVGLGLRPQSESWSCPLLANVTLDEVLFVCLFSISKPLFSHL